MLGIVLAAAVACFARFSRTSDDMKVDVGVAFMIPHTLGLALLNGWAPQPTTVRPVSSITVLILIFGMLAPARPARMLIAASLAASMDPLAVWLAHLRGLPVPSALLRAIYPAFRLLFPNQAIRADVTANRGELRSRGPTTAEGKRPGPRNASRGGEWHVPSGILTRDDSDRTSPRCRRAPGV
jgi:hypothetical protein